MHEERQNAEIKRKNKVTDLILLSHVFYSKTKIIFQNILKTASIDLETLQELGLSFRLGFGQ